MCYFEKIYCQQTLFVVVYGIKSFKIRHNTSIKQVNIF